MVDTNTIIEGTVKFRDGKKWKSRWCVMRKLSPVADCLHLQLYRDSKDRYKQGQTKASLSLQHFLGVQSGFTLDKESNTVAIICQDVTVVLAFDTRERLIQWQVKIASNLGEDEQFLVQLSSAPLRAKLQPGPALLHVLEHQFCLTVGVPPRLVGHWQISQLRRYGVVESRFCFEGGSRCGKGEGLYVLVTDQGDEISRTFRLAADGKLTSKKRPTSRSASDSPKKNNVGRPETRLSDISCLDTLLQQTQISELRALEESLCDCECSKGEDVLSWHTSEHTGDFADTSSVTNYVDSRSKESRVWAGDTSMERCASCISKLGAVSRSSTAVITPNSPFLPAWTMEENKSTGTTHELKKGGEVNLAYENTQVLTRSECSTAEVPESWNLTDKQKIVAKERCLCCPPERPPKPGNLCSQPTKPIVPGSPKRCQNISSNRYVCNSSCSCNITVNPYDNYDVPSRASQAQFCFKDRNMTQNSIPAESEYYDTPKHVTENVLSQYVNYDIPPPVVERKHMSSSLKKNQYIARVVIDNEDMQMMACPCQRMMCWAENWMILPYCRRGNGRENTAQPLHKKTAVCEEQFLCNSFSSVYATVDKSKKTRNRQCCNKDSIVEKIEPQSASYVQDSQSNKDLLCSVDRQMAKITETTKTNASSMMKDFESALLTQGSDNYMNSAFLHSLEFYENSKDLRDKSVKTEIVQTSTDYKQKSSTTSKAPPMVHSLCKKCSHEPKLPFHNAKHKQDDYLMMEPSSSDGQQKLMDVKPICYMASCNKQVPGYLPMHPVGGSVFTNTHDLLKTPLNQQLMSINDRAASSPSLTEHNLDKLRKGFDLDMYRTSGTPNLTISHSMSASNSPYLRKRVLNCAKVLAERETNKEFPGKVKLPNSSLSSEEFDISLDRSENICTLQHNPNVSRNSNIRSKDISKQPIVHSQTHKNKLPKDSCDSLAGHEQLSSVDTGQYENIDWEKLNLKEPIVHIRSSSVPNKCSHNRDSSSSNDSGVSSCSMKRRNDLVKDDNLVGNIVSSRRYTYTRDDQNIRQECFHSSLPRRSKSVDPLSDIAFQFQKVEVPMKSSSAEAEVPVCHSKQEAKGCRSPSGTVVPYMDSRSTSSGTSDMSDYFETLSLSSYSSSDTHDSLHFGHQAVSTMRPRSGKEYQKIDRNFLEENVKGIPIPADIQNQNSNNEGTS